MVSQHFSRHEFACKCGCGQDTVDAVLVAKLECARAYFGQPITITSGNRCKEYNEKVGGSPNSQHLYGKAADIYIRATDPKLVFDYFDENFPDSGGLGGYDTFTHVDSREDKARWKG